MTRMTVPGSCLRPRIRRAGRSPPAARCAAGGCRPCACCPATRTATRGSVRRTVFLDCRRLLVRAYPRGARWGGGWSARTECCHGMLNGCIQDPASTSRTRAPASESVQSTLSRTLPCCLAADSTRAAGTLSLVQDHDGERLVVVKCRSESSDRPSRMRRARYETPGSLRPPGPGPGSPSRASLFRAAPGSPQAHLDRLHVPRDVLELLRLSLELHPRVRPNVLHAAHLLHARDSGADSGGALFSVGRTGAASIAEKWLLRGT